MTLRPLGDRLIVEPTKEDEITKSGIILPDTIDREKPEEGKVIAIGSGKLSENGTRIPMEVKVGDTVVFKKYAPDEVKIDDKEYFVLSESDIMAVIE
ncbi:MAG: co-chaperone GroES [bacterium]|nr:co-chaperone GroES [bacterium]